MYATAYMRLGRAIERERTVKVHIVEFIRILGGVRSRVIILMTGR